MGWEYFYEMEDCHYYFASLLNQWIRDFPGGPVVKSSPSSASGVSSIPGLGTKIPHTSWSKNLDINHRSNIATNSIKTLKMVHIKKKKILYQWINVCSNFKLWDLWGESDYTASEATEKIQSIKDHSKHRLLSEILLRE